jgi:hypothetical protein
MSAFARAGFGCLWRALMRWQLRDWRMGWGGAECGDGRVSEILNARSKEANDLPNSSCAPVDPLLGACGT